MDDLLRHAAADKVFTENDAGSIPDPLNHFPVLKFSIATSILFTRPPLFPFAVPEIIGSPLITPLDGRLTNDCGRLVTYVNVLTPIEDVFVALSTDRAWIIYVCPSAHVNVAYQFA